MPGKISYILFTPHGMVHHGPQQRTDDVHANTLLILLHEYAVKAFNHRRVVVALRTDTRKCFEPSAIFFCERLTDGEPQ